jgi:hypothetical protein
VQLVPCVQVVAGGVVAVPTLEYFVLGSSFKALDEGVKQVKGFVVVKAFVGKRETPVVVILAFNSPAVCKLYHRKKDNKKTARFRAVSNQIISLLNTPDGTST